MAEGEQQQAAQAASDAPGGDVPPRIRAAWVAGPETFRRYGRTIGPLAVGLMDEFVDLTCLCPPGPESQTPLPLPCERIACPPRGWLGYGEAAIERLGDSLRRWKVDLIHALDASAAELARKLAAERDVPYLVTSFDLADGRRLAKQADSARLLLAGSEPIARALAGPRRAETPIRLFRPGVYHVRHATCFQDPEHSAAVVAGGSPATFAAFDAVLSCLAELVSRNVDCVLFVVGSGGSERRLRRQAARLALGSRLTFIDAMPSEQFARVLREADIYIAPAPRRSIDIHSLLAMAAGVPVLAATGGGANDFLRDGQTARCFAGGNATDLTDKLEGMFEDRAGARALADSALEYLRGHHSLAGNVAALAGMYREVLTARKASG